MILPFSTYVPENVRRHGALLSFGDVGRIADNYVIRGPGVSFMKKNVSPQDALARLEALCARSEQCSSEVLSKMMR